MLKQMVFAFLVFGLSASSFGATKKVLLAAIGGYSSCENSSDPAMPPLGMGMYPQFDRVNQEVSTKSRGGLDILWLAACLESDAPPEGGVQYVVSSDKDELLYGDVYDVQDAIQAIVKANPGITVFIAGHSYGGWSSMFLAQELPATIDIQGLFTLDPIGPACGPTGVIFGSDDCHSAPTDLDNTAIKKRLKAWVNFYQTDDDWLTSSEIPEAENHHITYSWGPHGDLDSDSRVWTRIQEVLETQLAL